MKCQPVRLLVLASLVALAGCAGPFSPATPAASPATSGLAPLPTGTWEGVIEGRELGTAAGVVSQKARLTLAADGTFTMETPSGTARGTVTRRGDALALDGRFVEVRDAPANAPATYWLRPAPGNALGGSATAYFAGHSVYTGIGLRKVN